MTTYAEKHRPRVHFSVPSSWMNDPNGLVYANGVFHLFYQYHPFSAVWGPMHWGHAISTDLVHWENLPIALSPNELGTIFSGCAVVDDNNVTGFQSNSSIKPLIAIFTQHLESDTGGQIQRQCLAYSMDNGYTWTMYQNNPILDNPGIVDFRDPKVFTYEDHFIMVLAAGDRVIFYKSYNLLSWEKLSEFGANHGSHGGVWECPDLFPLKVDDDKELWVLLVSINPGGPNGGSATQYFVGYFDGEKFENHNSNEKVLWVDYGTDCYAGITWFGTSNKSRCFIGWMNNWSYGNDVPTNPWRGQMTIPRSLMLKAIGDDVYLVSHPVSMISKLHLPQQSLRLGETYLNVKEALLLFDYNRLQATALDIKLLIDINDLCEHDFFELHFSNDTERIILGYSNFTKEYYFDRSKTNEVKFHSMFSEIVKAPRLKNDRYIDWRIVFDVCSMELFADDGLTLLTSLFFSEKQLIEIHLKFSSNDFCSESVLKIKSANFDGLKSIWS